MGQKTWAVLSIHVLEYGPLIVLLRKGILIL